MGGKYEPRWKCRCLKFSERPPHSWRAGWDGVRNEIGNETGGEKEGRLTPNYYPVILARWLENGDRFNLVLERVERLLTR